MTTNKLTEKEFKFYLLQNCETQTLPKCSDCYGLFDEIYKDSLSGDEYCYDCLFTDLSKDIDAVEELREKMKEELGE